MAAGLSVAEASGELLARVGGGRRRRMLRHLVEHPELDEAGAKGKLTFDLGRSAGSGLPQVWAAWAGAAEQL